MIKPQAPKRQFTNRMSPELSIISEETSGCLSGRSSMRRNEDTDEDSSTQTEENEPTVGLNQSSKLLSNDVIKIELFLMNISFLIHMFGDIFN